MSFTSIFSSFGFRVTAKLGLEPAVEYFIGNFTLGGQVVGGGISCARGSCALIDAVYTPSVPAKVLYGMGGVCQLAGGTVMLAGACVNTIVPWSIPVTTVTGECCRTAGKYLVKSANAMNPLPCTSKGMDIIPDAS